MIHKLMLLLSTHQVNTLPQEEKTRNSIFGILQILKNQLLNMKPEVSSTHLLSIHNKIGSQLQLNMELNHGKSHLKRRLKPNNQL
jgi:hypothetical protein